MAFSARPSDLSTGSDVYVWRAGWASAAAVTTSHADLFAGWFGSRILISEFSSVTGTAEALSFVYDPSTGSTFRIDRPMLLPVVDPTGRYLVYWSGAVQFDPSTGLWGAGSGDLYFDSWADVELTLVNPTPEPTATPTPAPTDTPTLAPSSTTTIVPSGSGAAGVLPSVPADPEGTTASPPLDTDGSAVGGLPTLVPDQTARPQMLPVASASGLVKSWVVRWDATGRYVAIWVADVGQTDIGVVTLMDVVPGAQVLNTGGLLPSKHARSNIQFDARNFVYAAPDKTDTDTTYLFQLPDVPPVPSAAPTVPAATGSPDPSTAPSPISKDRPGN